VYLPGNNEGNWFNGGPVNLVDPGNFTVRDAEPAPRKETHPTLRI
jgi:hypothetical protein